MPPRRRDLGFQDRPRPEAVSDEGLDGLVTELAAACRGAGAAALLPRGEPSLGAAYAERAAGLLTWALRWAGNEQAHDFDVEGAEELHRKRLLYWNELYKAAKARAAPVAGAAERLRSRGLNAALRALEHVWQLQQAADRLHRVVQNPDDASVRDVVNMSDYTRRFLGRSGEDVQSPEEAARKRQDYEELVGYLLDVAAEKGYRKRGDVVYEEKTVVCAGAVWGTRAWQPADFQSRRGGPTASSIAAFVYVCCAREARPDMWRRFLALKGNPRIFTYLQDCEDAQFPFLLPKRNFLAFRNGVLDTAAAGAGSFYPHPVVARFLPPDAVAAKYFDFEVEPGWFEATAARQHGWWDIPTPKFQQVLDYQRFGCARPVAAAAAPAGAVRQACVAALERLQEELKNRCGDVARSLRVAAADEAPELLRQAEHDLERALGELQRLRADVGVVAAAGPTADEDVCDALPEEVQRWIYVFMGRMLHQLGAFDSWQVVAFIKGRAGSGKSLIAHVVRNFFAAEDFGVLSNNIERKFGLMSLVEKFAYVCFELKKSLQLDQAEFQSIVSGEDVSVAVKNQATRTVRWTAPGLLCGNEGPGYMDAQGSIARRLIPFNFRFSIADKDSNPALLQEILAEELAALIVKCNAAYRLTAEEHQFDDIWRVLPKYFKEERRSMQRDTDALYSVIWDDSLFDLALRDGAPDASAYYVPFAVVEEEYKARWRDVHSTMWPDALTSDKYSSAFAEAKLQVRTATLPWGAEAAHQDRYVFGLRRRARPGAGGSAYDGNGSGFV